MKFFFPKSCETELPRISLLAHSMIYYIQHDVLSSSSISSSTHWERITLGTHTQHTHTHTHDRTPPRLRRRQRRLARQRAHHQAQPHRAPRKHARADTASHRALLSRRWILCALRQAPAADETRRAAARAPARKQALPRNLPRHADALRRLGRVAWRKGARLLPRHRRTLLRRRARPHRAADGLERRRCRHCPPYVRQPRRRRRRLLCALVPRRALGRARRQRHVRDGLR